MLKLICLMTALLLAQSSYSMEVLRAFGCGRCVKWEPVSPEPVTVNAGAIVATHDKCRWQIGFEAGKAKFKKYSGEKPAIKLNTVEFEYGFEGHKRSGCEVVINDKRYFYSFDKIKRQSDWNIC